MPVIPWIISFGDQMEMVIPEILYLRYLAKKEVKLLVAGDVISGLGRAAVIVRGGAAAIGII